jgi:hypothetical protein
MKKYFSLSILTVAVMCILSSCNNKQTADQYLKDDNQRKDVIASIIHSQPYMAEMMHEMMSSDSCKQMMSQNMMNDPAMMNAMMDGMMSKCMKDSGMCKMMMGKTMDMCEADQSKCKMMMESMKSHSNVMKSMKGMDDMKDMDMGADKKEHAEHHTK